MVLYVTSGDVQVELRTPGFSYVKFSHVIGRDNSTESLEQGQE